MRACYGNVIERLACELPPVVTLLAAMLENQLEELARLHAQGMWVESPDEIGPNIRSRDLRSSDYGNVMAREEWLLWPRATDVLIDALESETIIRIDRGRIVSLAKRRAVAMVKDGRIRRNRRVE